MKIAKRGDAFEISSAGGIFPLGREAFEDLFFAIPLNSTAFYRLLTDQIPKSDAEREAIVAILDACSDMDSELLDLQDQIAAMGPS